MVRFLSLFVDTTSVTTMSGSFCDVDEALLRISGSWVRVSGGWGSAGGEEWLE